jgi:hypothetical protein
VASGPGAPLARANLLVRTISHAQWLSAKPTFVRSARVAHSYTARVPQPSATNFESLNPRKTRTAMDSRVHERSRAALSRAARTYGSGSPDRAARDRRARQDSYHPADTLHAAVSKATDAPPVRETQETRLGADPLGSPRHVFLRGSEASEGAAAAMNFAASVSRLVTRSRCIARRRSTRTVESAIPSS